MFTIEKTLKSTKLANNRTIKIPPLKTASGVLTTDADKVSTCYRAHSTTFNDLSDFNTESAVIMSYNNIKFFNPLMNENCSRRLNQ